MNCEDAVAALAAASNWHKATHSGGANGGCVEVGGVPGLVGVRDTTLGAGSPVLACTEAEWAAFLAGVKDHEFDL
jgi:predicted secreted Zn-dependent protease